MSTKEATGSKADVQCPTCDRDDFASVRGMKQHHKQAHGESIAGVEVECDWCGGAKRVPPQEAEEQPHHYCSPECQGKWLEENNTGEDNPRWEGGGIVVYCAWCGDPKRVRQSHADSCERHFCGHDCHAAWKSEHQTGEENPSWDGGDVEAACAWCGDSIYRCYSAIDRPEHNFCDPDCKAAWEAVNYAGPNGPNWRGGLVDAICSWCGKPIELITQHYERSENHFCNHRCYGFWKAANWVGPDHPSWNGGDVTVECASCGREKDIKRSQFQKYERHFCDQACQGAWMSENWTGENNPYWGGGWDGYYGPTWTSQRAAAVERDGGRCQSCGLENAEHERVFGRAIHVHHIIKFQRFNDSEEANRLNNLITLCQDCHFSWERFSPLRPTVA